MFLSFVSAGRKLQAVCLRETFQDTRRKNDAVYSQEPTGGMPNAERRAQQNVDVLHMNHTHCMYEW